jgi:hypothetical protein
MIKFYCPHCRQKLGVPDEYAGRRVRCSRCKQPGTVPSSTALQPSTAKQLPSKKAASRTAHQTSTAALTSQGSYAPVKRAKPKTTDDEAARREAIRLAAKNRHRASEKPSGPHAAKPSGRAAGKADRLTLQERVPDALRLPLGIVFGFAASGLAVLVWVLCSRLMADALCFMALFVPIAAAYALRGLIIERGLLIGALCVLIGALSIAAGKAAIAHFVVIPYFQAAADEEVWVDMASLMADPKLQFNASGSIKPLARDGDYMTCAGLASLVEEGAADPVKARQWAVRIMLNSNKLSLLGFFDRVTGGGAGSSDPFPALTSEDAAVFDEVSLRLMEWFEDETELQMARKYYPAVARITQQAKIFDMFSDRKMTYQLAFLNTLGLFDLVWICMGLGIGYAVTVFD